jgi:type IV fimbrial biogenesis protein FimT
MRAFKSQSGFTLVELMITVVILAILVALAAPSFTDLIDRNRLKKQMTGVVDVFEFARSEAQKRSTTTFGSTAVSVEIAKGANDQTWTVTARHDNETRQVSSTAASGVALVSNTPAADGIVTLTYSFRGIVTGFTGGAATETFTLRSPRGREMSITLNAIGRVAVCSTGGAIWGYPSC